MKPGEEETRFYFSIALPPPLSVRSLSLTLSLTLPPHLSLSPISLSLTHPSSTPPPLHPHEGPLLCVSSGIVDDSKTPPSSPTLSAAACLHVSACMRVRAGGWLHAYVSTAWMDGWRLR